MSRGRGKREWGYIIADREAVSLVYKGMEEFACGTMVTEWDGVGGEVTQDRLLVRDAGRCGGNVQ